MENFDASKYRERSTGEIAKEQQQLERLRQQTFVNGRASWEWDSSSHSFIVSDKWEELTGYKKDEIFPTLSPNVPIEGLLDNIVDGWLKYIHPDDKDEVKAKSDSFLLLDNTSRYIELEFLFKSKSDGYIPLISFAQSVWESGKLTGLFVQIYRPTKSAHVEKYLHEGRAATAITINEDSIESQGKAISTIKSKVEEMKKLISVLAPVMIGLIYAINEFLPTAIKEIQRSISLFWNPPVVEQVQFIDADGYLLGSLSPEAVEDIKTALVKSFRAATIGSVQLAAYYPSEFPSRYKLLIQVDQTGQTLKYYQPEKSTIEDIPTTARTESHVAESAYDNRESDEYSTPFRIVRKDGREQILFVAVKYETSSKSLAIATADNLAESLKKILEAELSNEDT